MNSGKLVKVATIADAHGIKGEVRLRIYIENPQLLSANAQLFDAAGKKNFSIKITGSLKNGLIARIDGVADRNTAELLKNTDLYLPDSAFPEPEEGEYYHNDIIGLEARFENGVKLGVVSAIHNYGAGDILEIEVIDGEAQMLPLNDDWVLEINLELGFIVVNTLSYI